MDILVRKILIYMMGERTWQSPQRIHYTRPLNRNVMNCIKSRQHTLGPHQKSFWSVKNLTLSLHVTSYQSIKKISIRINLDGSSLIVTSFFSMEKGHPNRYPFQFKTSDVAPTAIRTFFCIDHFVLIIVDDCHAPRFLHGATPESSQHLESLIAGERLQS